jgi:hypothetical protein
MVKILLLISVYIVNIYGGVWVDTSSLTRHQNLDNYNSNQIEDVSINNINNLTPVASESIWPDTSSLKSNPIVVEENNNSDSISTDLRAGRVFLRPTSLVREDNSIIEENSNINSIKCTDIVDNSNKIDSVKFIEEFDKVLNSHVLGGNSIKEKKYYYVDHKKIYAKEEPKIIYHMIEDVSLNDKATIISKSPIYRDGIDNKIGGVDFHNSLLYSNMLPYMSKEKLYYISNNVVKYKNCDTGRYTITTLKEAEKHIKNVNKYLDEYVLALTKLSAAIKVQKSPIRSFDNCYQLSGYYPKTNTCMKLFKSMSKSDKQLLVAYGTAMINKVLD